MKKLLLLAGISALILNLGAEPVKKSKYTLFIPDPGELATSEAQLKSPKPLEIFFNIDTKKEMPKLRPLHGVANYVPVSYKSIAHKHGIREALKELKLPYTYLHDDPVTNMGLNVVDVTRIFPLFHADENDPANYLFVETDAYLKMMVEDGVKIIFRLGETIETSATNFRTVPPKDYAKWTRICMNIVRHYNEGWANGYHWNIKDWAVWEEPNNPNLWHGTFEQYMQLYKAFAPEFKKNFPHLNVGGPQTTTLGYRYLEQFLKFVRDEKLPLDFVAYTAYYITPADMLAESVKRREMLDKYGFEKVPLWTNEWHCSPYWYEYNDPVSYAREEKRFAGTEGGVFAATVLCGLQDSPLERACFYSACLVNGWGMFDCDGRPAPVYYIFKKFSPMYQNSVKRIAVDIKNTSANTQALASLNKDGNIEFFSGVFSTVEGDLTINIPEGYKPELIQVFDDLTSPYFVEMPGHRYSIKGNKIVLDKLKCASAFYIVFKPVDKK